MMKLKRPFWVFVKDGSKPFELRLNDKKWDDYQVGTTVCFISLENPENTFMKTIVSRTVYDDFPSAIAAVGFEKCMPNMRSFDDTVEEYRNIADYRSRESHGVIVFGL